MSYRVLLVDDEPTIRMTMSAILRSSGFVVVTALSAQDAKNALAQAGFDVVITDLKMESAAAGYEVAEFARQQMPPPAVIIFTGFSSMADHWKEHGAQALLEKPVPIATVLQTIEQLIQLRAEKIRRMA